MGIDIDEYFNGVCCNITKEQENVFLSNNSCKNTGILAEKYVANLLKTQNIKYKQNIRIKVDSSYIIPDIYLPDFDILLEIKSRSYTCNGTASEKIDNIPRKYSKIMNNSVYKNTKVIVVFCAFETINKSSVELITQNTEYSKDFRLLCEKYNVINWIHIKDLISILPLKIKPFIKWVGGKTKLSKQIMEIMPLEYNKYYEPFVGGGCIGLSLDTTKPKFFSDINEKLILCYTIIKTRHQELIEELSKYKDSNNKEEFLQNRERFNSGQCSDIEIAALFIYLNKCCFNGMYRENGSGLYNVPFGNMKNPLICDTKLIENVSRYLQNVDIKFMCYLDITPEKGDLVYFDPPYHGTFSDYTKNGFSEENHKQLKLFVDELTTKNVKIMLSNSNTPFINELYKDYIKHIVSTRYSVGVKREKVDEILITNF